MQKFDYTPIDRPTSAYVLTAWSFTANTDCQTTVLPDGCQDFIINTQQGEQTWFISDLSQHAYEVTTNKNACLYGLRLRPGTQINELALSRWLTNNETEDLINSDQIDEFCCHSMALTEALDCLALTTNNIQSAAQDLGVSSRSLQRLIKEKTGFPPRFWWSLARARRTARSLSNYPGLAEAAEVFGFSDQAHMTREIRRWFGTTPKQLRSDQALLALLHDTGYG